MLGKRLYKTSMIWAFKIIVLSFLLFFFNDFYLDTISDDRFLKMATGKKVQDFIAFTLKYPGDLISFVLMNLTPCVYFAFIRGVRFYEKGIVINRGMPFLNTTILYDDIKTYKLLHPKLAISIHSKKGDAFVVADENVERGIAIMDQHNIQGDLASSESSQLVGNAKKLIFLVAGFIILLFLVRKLGLYFFYQ